MTTRRDGKRLDIFIVVRNGKVILTTDQVLEIYNCKLACETHNGIKTPRGLSVSVSRLYQVSPKAIRDIWNHITWKRVTCHLWRIDAELSDTPPPNMSPTAICLESTLDRSVMALLAVIVANHIHFQRIDQFSSNSDLLFLQTVSCTLQTDAPSPGNMPNLAANEPKGLDRPVRSRDSKPRLKKGSTEVPGTVHIINKTPLASCTDGTLADEMDVASSGSDIYADRIEPEFDSEFADSFQNESAWISSADGKQTEDNDDAFSLAEADDEILESTFDAEVADPNQNDPFHHDWPYW
jgi:hypothetical protein